MRTGSEGCRLEFWVGIQGFSVKFEKPTVSQLPGFPTMQFLPVVVVRPPSVIIFQISIVSMATKSFPIRVTYLTRLLYVSGYR